MSAALSDQQPPTGRADGLQQEVVGIGRDPVPSEYAVGLVEAPLLDQNRDQDRRCVLGGMSAAARAWLRRARGRRVGTPLQPGRPMRCRSRGRIRGRVHPRAPGRASTRRGRSGPRSTGSRSRGRTAASLIPLRATIARGRARARPPGTRPRLGSRPLRRAWRDLRIAPEYGLLSASIGRGWPAADDPRARRPNACYIRRSSARPEPVASIASALRRPAAVPPDASTVGNRVLPTRRSLGRAVQSQPRSDPGLA